MSIYNGKQVNCSTFKNTIEKMIATSSNSYKSFPFKKGEDISYYSKEEVERIIYYGNADALREVSTYFVYSSGFYRRFLSYYATLLKYSYLLIPHVLGGSKIEDQDNLDSYYKALEFMHNLDLRNLSRHIAFTTLVKGAYYGILRSFEDGVFAVQDLPHRYCRSRFKNQYNVAIVELKLSYFDTITDKNKRDEVIKGYPKKVRLAYNNYKNRGAKDWVAFDPGEGLYFKLFDERPYFSSILPAIIDFKDYRELEKQKDEQDLKSLLIQEVPIEDGELVFEPEEVEALHSGVVGMLKRNVNTDILTTFAKTKLEQLDTNRSVVTNNLEKIEKSLYSEAGVSKGLFSAEGNIALSHSITNDMTLMLTLGEQICNWLEYNINIRFQGKDVFFKTKILPISYYNAEDMQTKSLLLAQAGYSFLIPALCFDLEQEDLSDLKNLEVNALKLNEIMIPLASSYTTSSGNPQEASQVNEVSDANKSDKTIENQNSAQE